MTGTPVVSPSFVIAKSTNALDMAEQCLKRRRKSLANDPVVEGQEPKAYEAPATAGSAGEGYEDVIDGECIGQLSQRRRKNINVVR